MHTHILITFNCIDEQQTSQHKKKADDTQVTVIQSGEFNQHTFGPARRKKPRNAFNNQDNAEHNN